MGRKILVICTILALACNFIGLSSMNNVNTAANEKQVILCDRGEYITNLQLKL
ncbi:hypothetical protein [Lachnoclostridium phytofermentans]|jgi:hypothetical protein|uniref:hypothetical protein n=1 Tax=Lachnoclostridium phytofermentans TaxID=66219 RepID=UPI0012DEB43A|nr:hypothetical protein [Lachnoclostridium phytofermentans]